MKEMKGEIFLCYAHEDKLEVTKIYQRLSRMGFSPWMDAERLRVGEDWPDKIREAIRTHDFFLVCISRHLVAKYETEAIHTEIECALEIQQKRFGNKIYIIPVCLDDCPRPSNLAKRQWVDWTANDAWDRLIETLLTGIAQRRSLLTNLFKDMGNWLIGERHWPLLLLLTIPLISYLLLPNDCQPLRLALRTVTAAHLWAAATLMVTGVLYWAVRRQAWQRLWVTGLTAALGLLLFLFAGNSGGKPRDLPNKLVVSVLDFTGANAQVTRDGCLYADRLLAEISAKTAPDFPVHAQRCYQHFAYDTAIAQEGNDKNIERAKLIAERNPYATNIVIWGEILPSEGRTYVYPHLLITDLPESSNTDFNRLAFITKDYFSLGAYELKDANFKETLDRVRLISTLAYPKEERKQAIEKATSQLEGTDSSDFHFYRGVLLAQLALLGQLPNFTPAIEAFNAVKTDEKELQWKTGMNLAVAEALQGRYADPAEATGWLQKADQLYQALERSPQTNDDFEMALLFSNHGLALFEWGYRMPDNEVRDKETKLDQASKKLESARAYAGDKTDGDWRPLRSKTEQALGSVCLALGLLKKDRGLIDKAASSYQSALGLINAKAEPEAWVRTSRSLADVQAEQAGYDRGADLVSKLRMIEQAYQKISTDEAFERSPQEEQARVFHNWGDTWLDLGAAVPSPAEKKACYEQAREKLKKAQELFQAKQMATELENNDEDLRIALRRLGQ